LSSHPADKFSRFYWTVKLAT